MKNTSKITNVQGCGTWNNKIDGSLMYKYDYDFEDGTKLQASHKSEMPFKKGDTVEYEMTHPDKNYGKVSKPKEQYNGFKKSQESNASFALAYAKDIGVAYIEKGSSMTTDEILKTATEFNEWLNNN